jgi:KipI family sensor histidine kinase inhibitor
LRFISAGPSALLVELDGQDEVFSLVAEIDRRRQEGWAHTLVDVVPGATTVLLDGVDSPERCAAEMATWALPSVPAGPVVTVDISCRYDGPDLAEVAKHWGVTETEVAEIHSSLSHRVAFCGFAPGFAYIDGLGERWQVPRRPAPRATLPAGSVGLGGTYTGIYPRSSPGGWQIIGHTDATLWDAGRDPPALLAPGTAVRFVAV